ncbi:hypothetical protein EJB05_19763, partial [Eragrostis curvula]
MHGSQAFLHPPGHRLLICFSATANTGQMRPPSRGHRATASLALLLLLSACSALPAARSQATTSTITVGGRDFTTFSFPKFDKNPLQLSGNLTISTNASISQGALQITPDTMNNPTRFLVNQAGRIFYATPFRRRKIGDDPSSVSNNAIDFRSIPGVPKEYEYRELKKGTGNFDEKMKLGQGGYGVVYRATVPGENGQSMEVAVKQFSGANTKGQEDFLAELSIINRLRHKNLVKLVGEKQISVSCGRGTLHGAGRVLEAVDPRLGGEFDEGDAERLLLLGLACSHPNPGERPKAQAILQSLMGSVPPPAVPMSKPVFMWPVPCANDGGEEEYGDTPLTSTSTAVTSSSYYASSSGWTQNYQVSREDHQYATEKDVSAV